MRSPAPKPIADVISAVVRDLGIGTRLKQFEVLDAWPTIVGKRIAMVAVAERLKDGKLTVRVSNAAWRYELVFLKSELITRINQAMNQELVKDIQFR